MKFGTFDAEIYMDKTRALIFYQQVMATGSS